MCHISKWSTVGGRYLYTSLSYLFIFQLIKITCNIIYIKHYISLINNFKHISIISDNLVYLVLIVIAQSYSWQGFAVDLSIQGDSLDSIRALKSELCGIGDLGEHRRVLRHICRRGDFGLLAGLGEGRARRDNNAKCNQERLHFCKNRLSNKSSNDGYDFFSQ